MSVPTEGPLLVPGQTCWGSAQAHRYAVIVDGADYLRHVKATMLSARRRIVIIGWDLDYRTAFERGTTTLEGPNRLGPFLHWLLWKRPELEVYLLKSNLRLLPAFDGFWFGVAPVSLLNQFTSPRMHFAVDGVHPTGAVHHQKIVVVDDAVAFCGGIDLTIGRWDTSAHLPADTRRHGPGDPYGPRHEVAAAVDGPAAQLLAQQAHERWSAATGEALAKDIPYASPWPEGLRPSLCDVEVAVARTLPALPQRTEVREIEALDLAAIAAAKDVIYLENQYFASRSIAVAIAARLREEDGPEVVIVLPRSSESRLEVESMDSARERLVRLLRAADLHGRLGIYWPAAGGGVSVYVHSKIIVIDGRLLRIGSSNFNNRSLGFDSECDVAIEADPALPNHEEVQREILFTRDRLVAEHLGATVAGFRDEVERRGTFRYGIEELRGRGRSLRKLTDTMMAADESPFAENDLMDPDHVPASIAVSTLKLVEAVALWPLRHSPVVALYQKLRGL
ncbi:phospholipase D/transphosphatidylase [Mycolicibacterium madagascariense]|uniref:Phospholipase D/transphosphatidylase n=1 Tax=Mycolicibacterium madagascariense TaxID=212765 RepID=A0A7I7XDR3_9MYCO|nr:phospholipase D-like domain-containing protein [Mycolicibacterium madagascariense]MCV7015177.1 phospholipase [Mycolicibacterium madagascariense]BBZ27470.1 phospholipase D/transphosphatidylase [Mycolicibacterium madagascariense]